MNPLSGGLLGLLGGAGLGGLGSGNKQGIASALLGLGPGSMMGGGQNPMMGAFGIMPGMMMGQQHGQALHQNGNQSPWDNLNPMQLGFLQQLLSSLQPRV